jgi:2-aminoethylphosphonate-pyruvate transaminase
MRLLFDVGLDQSGQGARLNQLQGSQGGRRGIGTFSVEANIGTLVPRDGYVLVSLNGAYCQRIARNCKILGRRVTTVEYAEDQQVRAVHIEERLKRDTSITQVAVVHCETSTGILNPLREIADVAASHGRSLIIDAMSSFGALEIDSRTTRFDALIAASGKCLEGVPGMGFVLARRSVLERSEGVSHSLAMDLYDQWTYMNRTTQWRYTPPTHVVAAFDAALTQYMPAAGWRPAAPWPRSEQAWLAMAFGPTKVLPGVEIK